MGGFSILKITKHLVNIKKLYQTKNRKYLISNHLLLLSFCYIFLSLVNLYGLPLLPLIALYITTILLSKKEGLNTLE
ncbi:hypothetical protein CN286_13280 [Bacillus anthracis]|nr:hypothetical protein CN286_13280 [Bacillus anthracis]PFM43924.1 hypothetical protein COJ45_26765 [Bacillus cereus]